MILFIDEYVTVFRLGQFLRNIQCLRQNWHQTLLLKRHQALPNQLHQRFISVHELTNKWGLVQSKRSPSFARDR